MAKVVYSLLFIIIVHGSYAQVPLENSFKNILASKKSYLLEKVALAEAGATKNQMAYDVLYYSLELNLDPTKKNLTGSVSIWLQIVEGRLDSIELNLWSGMSVTDVGFSGRRSSHNNDILTVGLDRSYVNGEKVLIQINYEGEPQNSPYNSFDFGEKSGQPMIWTLSQPFGARAWWPCKDVPSDKADSIDVKVTVPNGLIVVSNGLLKEKVSAGGYTTFWWHETYPIVTYLVSLAIHPYKVSYDDYLYNGTRDTMKIHFYMFEENEANLKSLNGKTKEMIAHFANLFGEYPFIAEKYGHADFLGGGAMEHQTCSSFGFWNEWVVAHELAHQWWGNMITCESFHHIWLNEGFASYCESLWYEYLNGPGTASEYQMSANYYLGPGTVYVESPETENIFDVGLSYKKGSWILHMLRNVIGEEVFFKAIKTYYNSHLQYGTATTEDFESVCEDVSGVNLDKFFHQWVYEEGFPIYSVSWESTKSKDQYSLVLHLDQKQTDYIFWVPLDITVTTADGETTLVVIDSLASQEFNFSLRSEPLKLEIDRENWVLKTVYEKITNPSFDKGILVVNGVNFDIYGSEIREAYENKTFWGENAISFWDCFEPPVDGYPQILPEPEGHGPIPVEVLGKYSTVVWVGNNYQGDLTSWQKTSILSYLESGGNLLLMTRLGQDFINDPLKTYLGIDWVEQTMNTINSCQSAFNGLGSMSLTGSQSLNALFDKNLMTPESQLLFKETTSFQIERGLGVWKDPTEGGTHREDGGQFVFISGRPYRYNTMQLRANVEYILGTFFAEEKITISDDVLFNNIPKQFSLAQNYPNPFNPSTMISYQLPITSYVEVAIYNLLGERISTLVSEKQQSGEYQVQWNAGAFSSGIYYYKLRAGAFQQVRKMIFVK